MIQNGKDVINDYKPMHHINYKTKSDNPPFIINDISYQKVRCDVCGNNDLNGKEIVRNKIGEKIDWKGVQVK